MTRLVCCLLLLLSAACDEMSDQPRYDPYGEGELFEDGKVMQLPPTGTLAQEDPEWLAAYRERPEMSLALLERGRERYGIYCVACHAESGSGRGVVPAHGFPQPPSFHSERLRSAGSAHIFNVITDGYGVMYSYADRVSPADRWAIAAYVRALQLAYDGGGNGNTASAPRTEIGTQPDAR
ncbi:c-type cytochrome [Pacificimonas flava]|uniref:ABC-type Fe3+ transport system protein n=1 Tax=Pacificimonas flava TaxID=1234595 RepID=M2U915_9SPHN|nr:cytochrome c [Pacificimonas flava]EMD84447.1 ABC-type Fe3+ transport system protein [Pacificimonas flava]MBB5279681.1 mono/diheme cytochrome c family protein [Pacificimonas flava]